MLLTYTGIIIMFNPLSMFTNQNSLSTDQCNSLQKLHADTEPNRYEIVRDINSKTYYEVDKSTGKQRQIA